MLLFRLVVKKIKVTIVGHSKDIPISNINNKRSAEDIVSPIRDLIDNRIEKMLLFRSRMRYAMAYTQDFLPATIFEVFPNLSQDYNHLVNYIPFAADMVLEEENVDGAVRNLSELLLHVFVVNKNNGWFFITQAELHLENKAIDDVAVTSKHDCFKEKLITSVENLQERKATWFELRFNVKDIEVLVTGGLSNLSSSSNNNNININAFLVVAAPATLALDGNFLLLAPKNPVKAVRCTRMLRNYKKQASMK